MTRWRDHLKGKVKLSVGGKKQKMKPESGEKPPREKGDGPIKLTEKGKRKTKKLDGSPFTKKKES